MTDQEILVDAEAPYEQMVIILFSLHTWISTKVREDSVRNNKPRIFKSLIWLNEKI